MNRRNIRLALAVVAILLIAAFVGIVLYLKSPAFEARARSYIIEEIERRTGATVTLKSFDWSFWERRFRIEDLTLRGLEPSYSAPLAHFARIDIGLNFVTLLQRRIDLFELSFTQPAFHLLVTDDGKTNIPSPGVKSKAPPDFQISIDNFNIREGSALINERRLDLDLSLQNLAAILKWHAARDVLEAHLSYDGVLDRAPDVKLAIPYTLYADLDYTRDTIVAHRLVLKSGKNEAKLQGRINQVLSSDISGKLDYTGTFLVRFLNYFFEAEAFAGSGSAAGYLEFARGKFYTQGNFLSDALDFEGWHATNIRSEYSYRYPDRIESFGLSPRPVTVRITR